MSDESSAGKPKLPCRWEKVRLPQIAQINPALDRCVAGDAVAVNFVPMRAVEPEGGGLVRPEVRPYGEVKKGYTAFLSGDVIMAKITPCMENGKTAVVPELPGSVCFGSTEFHVMRPENGVEARWIANFLLQHDVRRAAQRAMGGGVGQMRVPSAFLETGEIPLPPTAEQLRIADALDELLSDLDAGVAGIERVQAKLAQYRASVLKAAVEGALTADWRKKHRKVEPASALLTRILAERRRRWEEDQLRRFKNAPREGTRPTGMRDIVGRLPSAGANVTDAATGKAPPKGWKAKYKEPVAPDTANLPELPEGWCWATADQLAWGSGYGTSEKCRATNAGLAVLRIPNIIDGKLDLEDLKFAPPGYSEPDEELVSIGDLLVVRTNGSRTLIGRGAVVRDKPALHLSFASYLIRLRLIPLPSLLQWLSFLWESFHVRQWIEKRAATSAGQFNISLGVLETLAVPLPPSAEQEVIVEALEDQLFVVDHLQADLETKLKSAQALRQSILRHAFTGQLVPQDPKDEPAAELLKRIAAEREERTARTPRRGTRPTKAARPAVGRLPPAGGPVGRVPSRGGRKSKT